MCVLWWEVSSVSKVGWGGRKEGKTAWVEAAWRRQRGKCRAGRGGGWWRVERTGLT